MKLCFSDEFWNAFHQLSPHVQKQAKQAFEHFALDPRYPSLRFKCVNKNEAMKYTDLLLKDHRIDTVEKEGVVYYQLRDPR